LSRPDDRPLPLWTGLSSEPDELQSLKTQVARNWIVVDADMSDFEFNPDYGYRHARRHVIAEGVNDEVGLERRHEIASDNECRASSDDDENDTRVMPASSSLPLSSPSPTANTFSIHVSPLYSFLQEYGGWSMLYVHGVHDEFGQRNARILRELAKGVVAEIGDVGANVLVEAPIEFAEAMLTYLEQERSFQGRTFRKEL
jgi:hypothetical protein